MRVIVIEVDKKIVEEAYRIEVETQNCDLSVKVFDEEILVVWSKENSEDKEGVKVIVKVIIWDHQEGIISHDDTKKMDVIKVKVGKMLY